MRKNKLVIKKIHNAIVRTGVLSYIREDTKVETCQNCENLKTDSSDCYSCLLRNAKIRNNLDKVISSNDMQSISFYQNYLLKQAKKTRDSRFSRLSDIIESGIYLTRL